MGIQKFSRAALFAAVTALVLGAAATILAEAWWLLDLATHHRLQYLAAALLLAVVALILRPRWLAIPALAVAGLHAAVVYPHIAPLSRSAAATSPAGPVLRVMTINVRWSNRRYDAVATFIRETNADIVVMQEAVLRWKTALPRIAAAYPHVWPPDWRDGAKVIVFSRHPFLAPRTVYPVKRGFPFYVMDIDLRGLGARRLRFVGVHPPLPKGAELSAVRNAHFRAIAKAVNEFSGPVVVAGDFNCTPWSPFYRKLVRETGLTNAARGKFWQPTWPAWFTLAGLPIDHVFVKGGIGIRSSRSGPDIGSDHYPLVADLVVTPAPRR